MADQKITQEMLDAMPEETRNAVLATMAEAEKKETGRAQSLTPKVSAKGGVSTYGLGRWPVTLYLSQLAAFAEAFPAILDFAVANSAKLTVKDTENREALVQRVKAVRARIADPQPEAESEQSAS